MKISRGEFLTTVGTALLGAALSDPAAGHEESVTPNEPRTVGLADLRQQVHTMFSAGAPGIAAQQLQLTHVDDRSVDYRIEQFSAVFRGSADETLPDGTYGFQHPALGRLDLFIVAVGAPRNGGADHACYEACFSRFREMGSPDGPR